MKVEAYICGFDIKCPVVDWQWQIGMNDIKCLGPMSKATYSLPKLLNAFFMFNRQVITY